MSHVLVFDFLSHDNMHHPFNEGYLRMLAFAFPNDEITFFARKGHIDKLSRRFDATDRINFKPIEPFTVPYGMSRHNPVAGRVAGQQCLKTIKRESNGLNVRLTSLLGAEANLLWAARRISGKGSVDGIIHLILHNHISEAIIWRSRNPIIRAFDLLSGLSKELPRHVRLVALELGIADAVSRMAPAMAKSMETLEHPILLQEWGSQKRPNPALTKIAFVGHASRTKGFGQFVDWARANNRLDLEFHSIGLASGESFDTSGLARPPSRTSLSREEYVEALAPCDLVCLPLPSSYDYVASGSVIDAIAQLKPLYSIRNNSLSEIEERYGEIGFLAANMNELHAAITSFDQIYFAQNVNRWQNNLIKIRAKRQPQSLSTEYSKAVLKLNSK